MEIKPSKQYRTKDNHLVEIYKIGDDYIFGAIDRGWGWNSITWDLEGKHESNPNLDIISEWGVCPVINSIIKCECGSAKLGSDRHSTWCPKYE